jgi:hypothetical protein
MCILRDEDCTLSGHEVVSLRADFPEIFNAYDARMMMVVVVVVVVMVVPALG